MTEVKCDTCGKTLNIKPCEAKRKSHHFCNRTCYGKWFGKNQSGKKNKSWNGGKKKSVCEYCKKEFAYYPNRSSQKHSFCSHTCYDHWREEKRPLSKCMVCGKEKISKPSRLKKGIDKTCSKTCEAILKSRLRLKEGNPNWNNGSSQEDYCPKFNRPFREGVRVVWHYMCGLCKKHQEENLVNRKGVVGIENLSVHHVHYKKTACCDGDQGNWHFIPLCAECHGKTNGHRKEYEEVFMEIIQNEQNGKSYLTESEYIQFFAKKRLDPSIGIDGFLHPE